MGILKLKKELYFPTVGFIIALHSFWLLGQYFWTTLIVHNTSADNSLFPEANCRILRVFYKGVLDPPLNELLLVKISEGA